MTNQNELNQNLCCAKLFLNMFGLYLRNEETIVNNLEEPVGKVSLSNNEVIIQAETEIGTLNASYKLTNVSKSYDNYLPGKNLYWRNNIQFQILNHHIFNGTMVMDINLDSLLSSKCLLATKLNYNDVDGENVSIEIDGHRFKYIIQNDHLREVVKIEPFNLDGPYMTHRRVEQDNHNSSTSHDSIEKIQTVWRGIWDNFDKLTTLVLLYKNDKEENRDFKYYDQEEVENYKDKAIQIGHLMNQVDESFSKKIKEAIDLFKGKNISFLENLIDISLFHYSDEIKEALFGQPIKKMKYYNGENTLLAAYLDINGENPYNIPKDMVFKKKKIEN